jgi:hypothetical protein
MKTELIDLNILPIETLAEMANEKAELVEKNARKTVSDAIDCGRNLTAIKDQIEHGKWAAWLVANWNYSQQTAMRYMQISNSTCVLNLKEAKSINEALRMISDDREEKSVATRAERIPDRVEVSIPDETFEESPCAEAISTCGRGDERENEEVDDDPTPDPPTIRKTAKGSEKGSEDKKPRTQAIVPEVLADELEDAVEAHDRTGRIIDAFVIQCEVEQFIEMKQKAGLIGDGKKAAKALRKLADKLDPPTKFTPPSVEDVTHFCETRGNGIDPEAFVAHGQANGWLLSNGNKMKDWRAAIITWEKRDKQQPRGRGNGNANGRSHNDGSVEAQAARLKEIFG